MNDMVVTGALKAGRSARFSGSLKCRKDISLSEKVEVHGSVISEQDISIGRDCRIGGPVLSERTIRFHAGSSVGSAANQTTVSGEKLIFQPGATVFGTVWAHREGYVTTPGSDTGDGDGERTGRIIPAGPSNKNHLTEKERNER